MFVSCPSISIYTATSFASQGGLRLDQSPPVAIDETGASMDVGLSNILVSGMIIKRVVDIGDVNNDGVNDLGVEWRRSTDLSTQGRVRIILRPTHAQSFEFPYTAGDGKAMDVTQQDFIKEQLQVAPTDNPFAPAEFLLMFMLDSRHVLFIRGPMTSQLPTEYEIPYFRGTPTEPWHNTQPAWRAQWVGWDEAFTNGIDLSDPLWFRAIGDTTFLLGMNAGSNELRLRLVNHSTIFPSGNPYEVELMQTSSDQYFDVERFHAFPAAPPSPEKPSTFHLGGDRYALISTEVVEGQFTTDFIPTIRIVYMSGRVGTESLDLGITGDSSKFAAMSKTVTLNCLSGSGVGRPHGFMFDVEGERFIAVLVDANHKWTVFSIDDFLRTYSRSFSGRLGSDLPYYYANGDGKFWDVRRSLEDPKSLMLMLETEKDRGGGVSSRDAALVDTQNLEQRQSLDDAKVPYLFRYPGSGAVPPVVFVEDGNSTMLVASDTQVLVAKAAHPVPTSSAAPASTPAAAPSTVHIEVTTAAAATTAPAVITAEEAPTADPAPSQSFVGTLAVAATTAAAAVANASVSAIAAATQAITGAGVPGPTATAVPAAVTSASSAGGGTGGAGSSSGTTSKFGGLDNNVGYGIWGIIGGLILIALLFVVCKEVKWHKQRHVLHRPSEGEEGSSGAESVPMQVMSSSSATRALDTVEEDDTEVVISRSRQETDMSGRRQNLVLGTIRGGRPGSASSAESSGQRRDSISV